MLRLGQRIRVAFICLAGLIVAVSKAGAQARYDGHDLEESFVLKAGAYEQIDYDTTVRIDSRALGLGTVVNLEERLNVQESTGTVFRVDGFYRFSDTHRVGWLWYTANREGFAQVVDDDIQIGDEVFQIGSEITTRTESEILKLGYTWSFINVAPYEFYLGFGLNVREIRFYFRNAPVAGFDERSREHDARGTAPLPTVSFGGRYELPGRWTLNGEYELFALDTGDYAGRLQESSLNIEHATFDHVGLGFGWTNFSFRLEAEDGDYRGEIDTTYTGLHFYLKGYY